MSEVICSTLPGQAGNIGEILLNRPNALNALNVSMCEKITHCLQDWQLDDSIKAVVIRGEGDRAFCAGGDIRQIYQNGMPGLSASRKFFEVEYRLNQAIFHFTKPYVALLDGITMGGGAGVSLHGSHPVATERFVFAMPETGIGFFPDVGGSYFLSRIPDQMGLYLGLTGDRIHAADALSLGLIAGIVDSRRQEELIKVLCQTPLGSSVDVMCEKVSSIVSAFYIEKEQVSTLPDQSILSQWFDKPSIHEVMSALDESDDPRSKTLKENLLTKSPTSLTICFEQIHRARLMNFDEIMKMEFRLACRFLESPDFYEGIRAAVIDKDQLPKWQPSALSLVPGDTVQRYFDFA